MLFLLVFIEHRTALSHPRLFLYFFLHVAKVLCTRAQAENKDALRDVCQNENQAHDGGTDSNRKRGGLCWKTLRSIVRFFHVPHCVK